MATVNELFAPKAADRYIVLGEKDQELPKRCKVQSYAVKESSSGKQYVELKCIDEEDVKLTISVFQRDVKRCVNQWGTNPDSWGWMQLTMAAGGSRYYLEPAEDQTAPEDVR